ncbi:MAG: sulfotransferase [Phycisphaera sp.]|nr:MAG: sulfotransferase [Phycisphaera sp.]
MSCSHKYQDIPLIVLTGIGRSGTTAFRKALTQHPKLISTGHEHNVVYDILDAALRNKTAQSRRYSMQVTDEQHDALFQRLILDLVYPAEVIHPDGDGILIFTGLTPKLASYLIDIWPNTKVLCLYRNGVDVIASRLKHEHLGFQPFEVQCKVWTNAAKMYKWACQQEHALPVKYDDLVNETDQVCKRVMAFCGLEASDVVSEHLSLNTYHPSNHGTATPWRAWFDSKKKLFLRIYAVNPWLSLALTSLGTSVNQSPTRYQYSPTASLRSVSRSRSASVSSSVNHCSPEPTICSASWLLVSSISSIRSSSVPRQTNLWT